MESRSCWNTPILSGTNGYFHGTPSNRWAETRGYAGWGGLPNPPPPSPADGNMVTPQLPTSAFRMVMARSVGNELMKLEVRQPLCASAYGAAAANSWPLRWMVSASTPVRLAAHSGE